MFRINYWMGAKDLGPQRSAPQGRRGLILRKDPIMVFDTEEGAHEMAQRMILATGIPGESYEIQRCGQSGRRVVAR